MANVYGAQKSKNLTEKTVVPAAYEYQKYQTRGRISVGTPRCLQSNKQLLVSDLMGRCTYASFIL